MSNSATVAVAPVSNPCLWGLRGVIRSDSGMILVRVDQQGRVCPKYRRSEGPLLLAPAPVSDSKAFPDAGLVLRISSSAGYRRTEIPVCPR